MNDLQSIVGEIDKIMMESEKTVVFAASDTKKQSLPTMEEISSTVAGVVMEEFPAGGDAEMFGYALVEAAIGASEDMDVPPSQILAGVVTFFQEAISSASVIAENYEEVGLGMGEDHPGDEGGTEDEDGHTGSLKDRRQKPSFVKDDDDDADEEDDDDEDDVVKVNEAYLNLDRAFPDMSRRR